MRRHRIGQHVGPVGVRAVIVLRTRLALRVGLHQKAAEIGNEAVDFIGLGLPPGANCRVERIGRVQPTDLNGRTEASAQIDAQSVRPEDLGERSSLLEVRCGKHDRACIDVGEDSSVDPDRSARPRVVRIARIHEVGQLEPVPDGAARVAALDGFVEVVPMIQDAMLDMRSRREVHSIQGLVCLQQAQEVKCTVQHPDILVRSDHRRVVTVDRDCADQVAFRARRLEIEVQGGDRRGGLRSAENDSAVLGDRIAEGNADESTDQLTLRGPEGWRVGGARRDQLGLRAGRVARAIAQPQLITILRTYQPRPEQRKSQNENQEQAGPRTAVNRRHASPIPCIPGGWRRERNGNATRVRA